VSEEKSEHAAEAQPPGDNEEPAARAESDSPDQKQAQGEAGSSGRSGFQAFVDGTARLGAQFGEAFKGIAYAFHARDHVVMVRVNSETLRRIDQLVDTGVFRSRSESAVYLIARGIQADAGLFEGLEDKVERINTLRDELRAMVQQNLNPPDGH